MAPVNPLDTFPYNAQAPAVHAAAVSPSDTDDLSPVTRALYIGTPGDGTLTVIMSGDTEPTEFAGVPAGILPLSVSRVLTTGTGASDIVALW